MFWFATKQNVKCRLSSSMLTEIKGLRGLVPNNTISIALYFAMQRTVSKINLFV